MSKRLQRIGIARAYDAPRARGEYRVLVDRLWPRGVSKETLELEAWLKDLAPSAGLRKWFGHRPERWEGFRERYLKELANHDADLQDLARIAKRRRVLLLFGARDEEHNNAVVLQELLLKLSKKSPSRRGSSAR